MADEIEKKKRISAGALSQARALLDVARTFGGPSAEQRRAIREKIETEIAETISESRPADDSVPAVFAALDAMSRWSLPKRTFFTALIFAAAFAIDASAPRELSILGVYLLPIVVVAWAFPDPSAWVVEIACGIAICSIEEVNAPSYSSTSLLVVSIAFRALFFAAVAIAAHDVKRAHRVLEVRSERDPLTGLLNRRGFEKAARLEIERARRHHRPIALAFLDIDDFKRINDQRGHWTGDRVLQLVGQTLLGGRQLDVAARVGGDEFVILMPETSTRGAQMAVERLRRSFHASARSFGVRATFTTGVATFARPPRHVGALLAEADRLLFEGKRTQKGSVRSRIAADTESEDPLGLTLRAIH
jgi:diguanylate cyclase (GGDEF)-like protein